MTNPEILELAKTCGFGTYTNDDGTPSDYFDCYAEQLLKFARAIREDGYNEGWESSNVSTEMNTWSCDD